MNEEMMKRISFKGLRISSTPKQSPTISVDDDDDDITAGQYEQPTQALENEGMYPSAVARRSHSEDSDHTPTTVRRKHSKSFLKTLKRKLTTNFKSRKEVSHIVDDDSSSETRGDDHHGASPSYIPSPNQRHRGHSCALHPPPKTSDARPRKQLPAESVDHDDVCLLHPTKEDLSKSTESSSSLTEDDKNIIPETEYGHAWAPVTEDSGGSGANNVQQMAADGAATISGPERRTLGGISVNPPPLPDLPPPPPLPVEAPPTCPRSQYLPLDITAKDLGFDPTKEVPKNWSLTKELFKLSRYGWYWGPITRMEAEEKLTNQQDGAFIVRDSSDERHLLSLSFRSYGRTLHTRIEHCNGVFSFYAQPETEGYPSIVDLIEHSMTDSQTGVFCYSRARAPGSPSFPVRLTKPVSRFSQVRSLQYLCRFVIRQYIRLDHIQQLPLPTSIKGWLEENQY